VENVYVVANLVKTLYQILSVSADVCGDMTKNIGLLFSGTQCRNKSLKCFFF